jgi:hypothetical protein
MRAAAESCDLLDCLGCCFELVSAPVALVIVIHAWDARRQCQARRAVLEEENRWLCEEIERLRLRLGGRSGQLRSGADKGP